MYYIFVVCFFASFTCVWSFSQCSHIYYSGIKSKTCSSYQTCNSHSFLFHAPASAHRSDLDLLDISVFSSYNICCCFDPFLRFWATGPESLGVIRSQRLFQRAWGNWGKAHLTPSGRVHNSSFHWGKKQWILCAEKLITRCICVLFSAQRFEYSRMRPQREWMNMKLSVLGHVFGIKSLCLKL